MKNKERFCFCPQFVNILILKGKENYYYTVIRSSSNEDLVLYFYSYIHLYFLSLLNSFIIL